MFCKAKYWNPPGQGEGIPYEKVAMLVAKFKLDQEPVTILGASQALVI